MSVIRWRKKPSRKSLHIVVESGSHEQLVAKDGTYREIFNASARSLNLARIVKTFDN